MKELHKINIDNYSKLEASFSTNDEGTILYAKYSGEYAHGSSGNGDGIFMFAKLASYYSAVSPITIILDLRELQYQWGNTIFSTLLFFEEIGRDAEERSKKLFIIYSEKNKEALGVKQEIPTKGNTIYTDSYDDAWDRATEEVKRYLE